MKLLFCLECHDLFKLSSKERSCSCGKARGRYVDDLDAIYHGPGAFPLGIDNTSLAAAIKGQPERGRGPRIDCFVINRTCPTFQKI